MKRTLAHFAWLSRPLAFLILTCITVYWIALVPSGTVNTSSIYFESNISTAPPFTQTHRTFTTPFATVSNMLHGRRSVLAMRGGITNVGPAFIVSDEHGARLLRNTNADITGPPTHATSVVQLDGTRSVQTYGLLGGSIVRYHTQIKTVPVRDKAVMPVRMVDGVINSTLGPNAPRFNGLTQTATRVRPLLLLYDTLFLAFFVLWAGSAALIPTWSIWTWWLSLFPKAKSPSAKVYANCPNCAYPTAGLTTDVCPECGNSIKTQAVS